MIRLRQLRCSFCRKPESRVEKLVAGPRAYTGARVYICDRCVAVAKHIMDDSTHRPASHEISEKD
jgi:ATP-dependent Clp protease ATP-binding subunit ClpX